MAGFDKQGYIRTYDALESEVGVNQHHTVIQKAEKKQIEERQGHYLGKRKIRQWQNAQLIRPKSRRPGFLPQT